MTRQPLEGSSTRRIAGFASAFLVAIVLLIAFPSSTGHAREALLEHADGPVKLGASPSGSTSPDAEWRAAPSARGVARSSSTDMSTPDGFIAVVGEAAQLSQRSTGVPASVTVAQAILESDWGKSGLATRAFNLFGIKSKGRLGPAGEIKMDTWEVFAGSSVTVRDGFRAYNDIFESVEDHGLFLRENARYAAAFRAGDSKEFARRIHAAGYATDPGYSDKLIRLMDKYSLYRFDTLTDR